MRAVGVHLDHHVVAVGQRPAEAGDVRRARGRPSRSGAARARTRSAAASRSAIVAGAVRAAVVDDQHVRLGHRRRAAGPRRAPGCRPRCRSGSPPGPVRGPPRSSALLRHQPRPVRVPGGGARPAASTSPASRDRDHGPLRAGPERVSEGSPLADRDTARTSTSAVKTSERAWSVPVRVDHRADPAGRGDQHRPAVLDRPQPAHRQLLPGLVAAPNVALLVCTTISSAPFATSSDQPVVRDLEADHVADLAGPTCRLPGRSPADEVALDQVDVLADQPGDRAQRDVLGERHRVPLDVALPRAGAPGPRRCRRCGWWSAGSGPSASVPTRIGTPTALAAWSISACASGLRIGSMSEAFSGQSTRSGSATRPARGVGGQRERRGDVVAQHGLALGVEVQARAAARCPARPRPCTGGSAWSASPPPPPPPRSPPPARPARPRPAAHRARGGPARLAGEGQDERREQAAGERDREGDQRRPAVRGQPGQRRVRLANASRPHGNPPNGPRSRTASCADPQRRAPTAASPAAARSPPARPRARPRTRPRRRRGSTTAPARRRSRSSSAAGRRTPARRPARPRPRAAPARRG